MSLIGIVPLFIALIFVIVAVSIFFKIVAGVGEWARNSSQPVEELPARLVSKRTELLGHSHPNQYGRVRTSYFATFELKSGERLEFDLPGRDCGLLVEGDEGILTFQGTRYHGFQRRI